MKSLTILVLSTITLAHGASCVKLFNSTLQLPANMTSECKDALTAEIECPRLITPSDALIRLEHNTTRLDDHCSDTCLNSLAAWSADITTCCGNTTYDFSFSTLLGGQPVLRSGPDLASSILWARNLTCLRDRNSTTTTTPKPFCAPSLSNGTFAQCSDCTLQYLATLLSSWYGVGRAPSRSEFDSLVNDTCCLNPSDYPIEKWTPPVIPPAPEQPNITCFTGCLYTVQEGDTCASIARSQGVAYDRFIYQNGLDFDCASPSVLPPGRELCIGRSCALYEVQANDTCKSILEFCGGNFTLTELLAWNPAIHRTCDNLSWLAGKDICIGPPGTKGDGGYEVDTTVGWGGQWADPTWGDWIAAPTVGEPWNGSAPTQTGVGIPVQTIVMNATAARLVARLVEEHCPIADEHWWQVSEKCRGLLAPYCDPHPDQEMPPRPEGGFPAKCLGSVVG